MPEIVLAYRKCGNRLSDHYEKREEDIKRQMKHVGYDFESWSRNHGMWEEVFKPKLVFAYRKCGNKLSVHYGKREEIIKRKMRQVGYDFSSWSRNHGMWRDVFREVDEEKEKEKEKQRAMGRMTALEYANFMNPTSDDDDDLLFKDVQEKEPPRKVSWIGYLISFVY
jgi:hypothetical protein